MQITNNKYEKAFIGAAYHRAGRYGKCIEVNYDINIYDDMVDEIGNKYAYNELTKSELEYELHSILLDI